MRKGFFMYHSYGAAIKQLSDKDCGQLFKALFDFSMSGATPENLSPAASITFTLISEQMSGDFENYENLCEKRKQSGKKGGRPVEKKPNGFLDSQEKPNGFLDSQEKPNGFLENQMVSEKTKWFLEKPIGYNIKEENIKEENIKEENIKEENIIDYSSYSTSTQNSSSVAIATDNPVSVVETREIKEIIDAWNALSSLGIQPIQKLMPSSKRGISLKARISEYGIDNILKAIENIRASDFLQGKNKNGWVITFDWFVLPNNFPKVLEGNYSNRSKEVESGNPFMQVLREMEAEDEQAGDY